MKVSVKPINFAELGQLWAQAPELVGKEMLSAMNESVALVHNRVESHTPSGVGFGGHLSASYGTQVTQFQDNVIGLMGTNKLYAEPVELGRKPGGKMPPVLPLIDWAEVVLGLEYQDAKNAAWAIAKTIQRKGSKGQYMFRDGFAQAQPDIKARFSEAMVRLKQQLKQV